MLVSICFKDNKQQQRLSKDKHFFCWTVFQTPEYKLCAPSFKPVILYEFFLSTTKMSVSSWAKDYLQNPQKLLNTRLRLQYKIFQYVFYDFFF